MAEYKFKSLPEYWWKEEDGRKPNTIRRMSPDDPRKEIKAGDTILIEQVGNPHQFRRVVSDVTEWEGLTIISWKHEALNDG